MKHALHVADGRVVEYFINEQPDLFYSEYPFDPTAFESTGAFAHYALEQVKLQTHSLKVTKADADRYTAEQLACNMATRGWLEPNYWQLGVEGNMRYMSQMGGWSILDYALNYARDPFPYLRLGYASLLSSWALMNTGTKESNYGYWYPGPENDGGAGSAYVPQAFGGNWFGKQQPRGAWQYSGEIDLGFSAGLRGAAVILADDPIFGWVTYGGELQRAQKEFEVMPQDGVGRRFHLIGPKQRFHLKLGRDGFAAGVPIVLDAAGREISFSIENRDPDHREHDTQLTISDNASGKYGVVVNGKSLGPIDRAGQISVPVSGSGPVQVILRRSEAVR